MARAMQYPDMRSVSLTVAQGKALDEISVQEDRPVANVIRLAVDQFLRERGIDLDEDVEEDVETLIG